MHAIRKIGDTLIFLTYKRGGYEGFVTVPSEAVAWKFDNLLLGSGFVGADKEERLDEAAIAAVQFGSEHGGDFSPERLVAEFINDAAGIDDPDEVVVDRVYVSNPATFTDKGERMYESILDGYLDRGMDPRVAKRIAAATVYARSSSVSGLTRRQNPELSDGTKITLTDDQKRVLRRLVIAADEFGTGAWVKLRVWKDPKTGRQRRDPATAMSLVRKGLAVRHRDRRFSKFAATDEGYWLGDELRAEEREEHEEHEEEGPSRNPSEALQAIGTLAHNRPFTVSELTQYRKRDSRILVRQMVQVGLLEQVSPPAGRSGAVRWYFPTKKGWERIEADL